MIDPKKKVKQVIHEGGEHLKKRSSEVAKETFTALSHDVISQLTGKEIGKEPKNFTPFNEEVRKKMGENFGSQDSSELEKVREQLADHNQPDALKEQLKQRRFEQVQQDAKQAYEQIKAEEEERKRKIEEEEFQEQQQAQQQNVAPIEEPQGKAARGGLFAKKKKKQPMITTENRPSQGKQ